MRKILLVGIVSVLLLYGFYTRNDARDETPSPSQQQSSAPAPTKYREYRNDLFLFQYPDTWKVSTLDESIAGLPVDHSVAIQVDKIEGPYHPLLVGITNNQDIESVRQRIIKDRDTVQHIAGETTVIANRTAQTGTYQTDGGLHTRYFYILLPEKSKAIYLEYIGSENAIENILETFEILQ